jgi:hypothetical protein
MESPFLEKSKERGYMAENSYYMAKDNGNKLG